MNILDGLHGAKEISREPSFRSGVCIHHSPGYHAITLVAHQHNALLRHMVFYYHVQLFDLKFDPDETTNLDISGK